MTLLIIKIMIWKVLGIEPTTDIKKIKAAYSRLAKQYNPEEHPDEFREIFVAYKAACAYAKSASESEALNENSELFSSYTSGYYEQTEESSDLTEEPYDFNCVTLIYEAEVIMTASEIRKKLLQTMRKYISDENYKNNVEAWVNLFSGENFEEFIYDREFRKSAADIFWEILFTPEAASAIASGFGCGSRAVPVNFYPVQEWKVVISVGTGSPPPEQQPLLPSYANNCFNKELGVKEWIIIAAVVLTIWIVTLVHSIKDAEEAWGIATAPQIQHHTDTELNGR